MERIFYVGPEIETVNILSQCIICQSYSATDVTFGPEGGAGSTIDGENYGGSF